MNNRRQNLGRGAFAIALPAGAATDAAQLDFNCLRDLLPVAAPRDLPSRHGRTAPVVRSTCRRVLAFGLRHGGFSIQIGFASPRVAPPVNFFVSRHELGSKATHDDAKSFETFAPVVVGFPHGSNVGACGEKSSVQEYA